MLREKNTKVAVNAVTDAHTIAPLCQVPDELGLLAVLKGGV